MMCLHPTTRADKDLIPATMSDDPEVFGRVALAVGGDSAEREVSLNGGKAVSAALERLGIKHEVFDGALDLFAGIREDRVDRVYSRLIEPVNANAGANLRMFALMGELDMVGDPVGTHHLADEFTDSS